MHSDPAERELLTGWRARLYRGRHRRPTHRVGHFATGLALFYAVHLR
jgi:hypothetical protein